MSRPWHATVMNDRPGESPEPDADNAPGGGPESTFALLERARPGDGQAIEELFHRYLPPWECGRAAGCRAVRAI